MQHYPGQCRHAVLSLPNAICLPKQGVMEAQAIDTTT